MRKVCLIKNTLKCCDMPSVYSLLEQLLGSEVAEWLAHWLLVLEVPGSIPASGEKICWSELASLRVICRNDMIKCAVLRIGTLTGGPLCRDSHPLCRLKIPTQVLSSCM